MEDFVTVLRRRGYKITPQRRAVIEALSACPNFSTAQQIFEYIKRDSPDMSLDTVYRNLALFVDIGIVAEINTRNKDGNVFELIKDCYHHHLVCIGCGKMQCLDFCPIRPEDVNKAEANGFKITSHSLEFYGYCRECAAKI